MLSLEWWAVYQVVLFSYFISDSLALQLREKHSARSLDCKSVAKEVIPLVSENTHSLLCFIQLPSALCSLDFANGRTRCDAAHLKCRFTSTVHKVQTNSRTVTDQ